MDAAEGHTLAHGRRALVGRAFALADRIEFSDAQLEPLCKSRDEANADLLAALWADHAGPTREITSALSEAAAPPPSVEGERGDGARTALAWKQKGDEAYGQWLAGGRADGAASTHAPGGGPARLLERALHAYTEALCSCDDALTALAYANRAAVLYQLERFHVAAEDCDRAQRAGYPEDKLFKLLQRRGNCRLRLGQASLALVDLQRALELVEDRIGQGTNLASIKAQLVKEVKQARQGIKGEHIKNQCKDVTRDSVSHQTAAMDNPRVAHASPSVAMGYSSEAGRYIVAADNIKLGEPVVSEEAYAAVLLRPFEKSHCHHCFTQEAVLIPCCRCLWARFCSESCREDAAWYHAYECGEAFFEAAPTLLVLSLRILLRAKQDCEKLRQTGTDQPNELQPSTAGTEAETEWRADYSAIYSLLPHTEDLPKETMETYIRYCIVAQAYVEHRTKRDAEARRRPSTSCGDATTAESNSGSDLEPWMNAGLLFRHLCQTHTNVYAIYEVVDDEHGNVVQRRVAEAMYATASLFNHSCCPNTVLNYNGRVLTLRACEAIPKGKEVLNCYGPHVAHMPSRDERQKALRQQYFFTCRCEACSGASGEGKQDFNYLVCGSEGCTHELQLNPEELRKGNYAIRCACGHQVDIRVVQREIKLAREFFDRARAMLDADTSYGAGDIERAVQSLTHSLRLRAKYLHPLHRELGRTHDALAEAHARLGRYEAAATHLERAVTVLESVFPPFSFELADQYAKLAQVWCIARSNPRRALAWIDKAERLWTVLTGSSGSGGSGQQARRGGQRVLDELQQMRAELTRAK